MRAIGRLLHAGRNDNTHQIEHAGELLSEIFDPGGTPAPDVLPLFIDDRGAVIEGVEELSQPEAVLGQHGELERADDLFDDLVEPRGFEYQRPQLVVAVDARERS